MKLYGYFGGSGMHGFPQTTNSDLDYYSVIKSNKVEPKIYPMVKIHSKKRTDKIDVERVELSAYFTYLMNGFLLQVESLFVPTERIHVLDDRFKRLVLDNKHLFIDRNRLVENVSSNIEFARKRTVLDMEKLRVKTLSYRPTDKIVRGITRMADEYRNKGYYHKDYLHGIRIAASVLFFLKSGDYPMELGKFDPEAYRICCEIKANPDKFTRKELDDLIEPYLKEIDLVDLENDEDKFRFDAPYVQGVMRELYA